MSAPKKKKVTAPYFERVKNHHLGTDLRLVVPVSGVRGFTGELYVEPSFELNVVRVSIKSCRVFGVEYTNGLQWLDINEGGAPACTRGTLYRAKGYFTTDAVSGKAYEAYTLAVEFAVKVARDSHEFAQLQLQVFKDGIETDLRNLAQEVRGLQERIEKAEAGAKVLCDLLDNFPSAISPSRRDLLVQLVSSLKADGVLSSKQALLAAFLTVGGE